MAEGFVLLHRRIMESELWTAEPFTRGQAWVDLLMLANHKDGWFLCRGVRIEVKRGQVGHGAVSLGKRWGWSRGKVNRFLNLLEIDSQIEQQKNNVTTLISIKNYEKYQAKRTASDTASGQQTDSKRTQTNNDNNDNNINRHQNLKVLMSKSWTPNESNLTWLNQSGLDGEKINLIIADFVDYWILDEGKKTENGWQMAFRRNPIVKRQITNFKHRGKHEAHQQSDKPTTALERFRQKVKSGQVIDGEVVG